MSTTEILKAHAPELCEEVDKILIHAEERCRQSLDLIGEEVMKAFRLIADAHAQALVKLAEREWRPIETAPRDGTSFLSLNRNQGNIQSVTWWNTPHQYFCATGGQVLYPFTHWQPLPKPPEVKP